MESDSYLMTNACYNSEHDKCRDGNLRYQCGCKCHLKRVGK